VEEIRAVLEPTILQHFGDVMGDFARIGLQHFSLEGSLEDVLAKTYHLDTYKRVRIGTWQYGSL
jgi:hypothetical protein